MSGPRPETLTNELDRLREENELLKSPGCRCQLCGEHYNEDLLLTDEVWNEIRPSGKPPGGGLLCGRCIGLRLMDVLYQARRHFDQQAEVIRKLEERPS